MDTLFTTLWTLIKIAYTVVSTFVGTLTSLPFGIGGIISTILWAGIVFVMYRYSPDWLRRHFKTVAVKIWSFVSPYIGSVFDMVIDRVRHRPVSAPMGTKSQPVTYVKRSLKQHMLFRVRWMTIGGAIVLGIQNWEYIYKLFF